LNVIRLFLFKSILVLFGAQYPVSGYGKQDLQDYNLKKLSVPQRLCSSFICPGHIAGLEKRAFCEPPSDKSGGFLLHRVPTETTLAGFNSRSSCGTASPFPSRFGFTWFQAENE
jgi:hypothetical protein